jgi:hypothetical protein
MIFARRLLILFVLLLCVSASGLAQTTPPALDTTGTVGEDFYRNIYFAVGLHASRVSGAGISGRLSLPKGYTFQLTTFVVTLGKYTHFNIGAEGQYAFIRDADSRFYSLLGAGFYTSSMDGREGNVIRDPFAMELGFGYEYFTSRNFVISLSGGISWFPETSKVYPLPQVGFFFYFR